MTIVIDPECPAGQLSGLDDAGLQQVLNLLPVGAYTCNSDGLITYCNAPAAAIWGRAPLLNDPVQRYCGAWELRDKTGTVLTHDQCWMAQALTTGRSCGGKESLVVREDGSIAHVIDHVSTIRGQDGTLLGALNIMIDVTAQSRAAQSRAQLAAIVESSDDAIISKSLTGQIQSWNRGAERIFGYSAEEAIGSPITMLIPPNRLEEEREIISRLQRGEQVDHFETIRRTREGRLIDISLTVSPIRDQSGAVVAASKIARDVTTQRRADAALATLNDELAVQLADLSRLHEMSTRLSTTLDVQAIVEESLRTAAAIADAELALLAMTDGEGRLATKAALGLDPATRALAEVLTAGLRTDGTGIVGRHRVLATDLETDSRVAPHQLEAARRCGIRAVNCTPLISRKGEVLGALSVFYRHVHHPSDRELRMIDLCVRQAVDFIENARLYEQLQNSHRLKDEFLATLAHELRNPLAPISNSLQVLKLSGEVSPSLERICAIMDRQVNHMIRLVEDLLEVSRITRGKIELRRERTDVSQLVLNAVEMIRGQLEESGHQLELSLPREQVLLDVDPVRLTQVISNLLGNAAKYTEPGGHIRVAAACEGDRLMLSVRDTGVGIPAEMIDRIFEMFSQVDQNLNRSRGGLGIGLTLARSLVQMHGGTISARSDGPGKGSEFIVRMPVCAVESSDVVPQQPASQREEAPPTRKILVVDDTRAAAYMLSRLLESLGQEVEHVYDPLQALQVAVAMHPEIILSDIAMPNIDGYELARRIRATPELKDIVLVAVTGFGQREDRERAEAAGFDFHLVKPASVQSIRQLLKSIPARRCTA